jgi:4a-hydroxytetrahydrobiopterin dehydratase
MAELLDGATVMEWLGSHGKWERSGDEIVRTVSCASFPAAIELVRQVGEVAEHRDHHPDMDIRWRNVRFALSTHSAGGLTQNDLDLAEEIDRLAG